MRTITLCFDKANRTYGLLKCAKQCRLKKGFRRPLCAMRTITLCFDKANRTYAATRLIFQTASSEYTSADNSFVSFRAHSRYPIFSPARLSAESFQKQQTLCYHGVAFLRLHALDCAAHHTPSGIIPIQKSKLTRRANAVRLLFWIGITPQPLPLPAHRCGQSPVLS